ncbi:MAG: ATP-binding protein [Planctomycetes bacterium]|nr:ATP-binding protein [Planctomycetota bacterium]
MICIFTRQRSDLGLHGSQLSAGEAPQAEGPGIPEDDLETIFEKFRQSSATKTGAEGTGLGLAICREIIDARNGRLWVENIATGGSVFILELPVRCGDEVSVCHEIVVEV